MSQVALFGRGAALAALSALALGFTADDADAAVISTEAFSYTGNVTVYDTLSDAQLGINARSGPHPIPTGVNGTESTLPNARDGSLYIDTGTGEFDFLTAWYFTPPAHVGTGTDGFGNPNNTNTGFVQLYDTDGSSLSALDMGWNSSDTEFSIHAEGANAGSGEFARLWPAPMIGGAAALSSGEFLEYTFDMTLSYGTPIPDHNTTDFPTDVAGGFSAIFQNTNTTDTALNGFYVVDFSFQRDTYAESAGAVALYDGSRGIVSVVDVPEPGALAVFGLGLAGLVVTRRKRTA